MRYKISVFDTGVQIITPPECPLEEVIEIANEECGHGEYGGYTIVVYEGGEV